MTKSKLLTIIAAVAVFLVVVLAAGLIFSSVTGKDKGGESSIADKVDTMVLQDIAFCGDSTARYSVQPMAATAADNEQVVSGDSTTITLKLTSNLLSEVMLEKVNVPITWGVEFVNPESAWASGKQVKDYVTVTPKSDFTRTVTVTNLAEFGEQIRLTATMVNDSSKTASCVINYVKRISGGLSNLYFPSDFGDDLEVSGTIYSPEAVGTVYGTLTSYGTYIELDEDFSALLKSYLKFDISLRSMSFPKENTVTEISYNSYYKYYSLTLAAKDKEGCVVPLDYSHFIANWDSLTTAQKNAVRYCWWAAYQAYGNNINIDIVFDYVYGGKLLSTVSGYQTSFVTGEYYGDGIPVDGSLVDIVF